MKSPILSLVLATVLGLGAATGTLAAAAKEKKEKKSPVDARLHYSVCVQSPTGLGCSAKKFTLRDAEDVINIILAAPIDADYGVAVYDWDTRDYVSSDQLPDVHQGTASDPKASPQSAPQHVQDHTGEEKI